MPYLLNAVYLLLLLALTPWLLVTSLRTGTYREGLLRKLLGLVPVRRGDRPCVWFHAVSVGEVLLLRQVVARFRERYPDWDCVISTTTNTGSEVARTTFPDLSVFYWPLDFTWAVRRALQRIRPSVVVLAELELWPNFIALARRRGCRLAVINGRMSHRSYRGYRRIRRLMAQLLGRLDVLAVQNELYAKRLLDLGAPADRVAVTGSVKFDGASGERANPKTRALGELLGIARGQLVWVAGSTQAPEEQIVLDIYRRAKPVFPNLRLVLVPRHKERFAEVAALLAASGLPFVCRSRLTAPVEVPDAVVLLDTLGELGALWGLADVAFVGGSIHPRGGQNLIEPAAYGAAVIFGPHVWNFQDTADRLLEHGAAVQVADAAALERETLRLLRDAGARAALGNAARAFVQSQQGATDRTLDLLAPLFVSPGSSARAA